MHGIRRLLPATVRGAVLLATCAAVVSAAAETAAQPAATGTTPAGPAQVPFWQAPAVPGAVVQGGAIPPGWQPQAVPYQGIGPDGRPMTVYVAPTYVFTYQSGPPVLAVPPAAGPSRATPPPPGPYGAYGWNYQSQGATAAPVALPPSTVARYQPAPYQFPADARALTGTPIVPPAGAVPPAGFAPPAAPPAQWAPVGAASP